VSIHQQVGYAQSWKMTGTILCRMIHLAYILLKSVKMACANYEKSLM